jgi:hypothetical protein
VSPGNLLGKYEHCVYIFLQNFSIFWGLAKEFFNTIGWKKKKKFLIVDSKLFNKGDRMRGFGSSRSSICRFSFEEKNEFTLVFLKTLFFSIYFRRPISFYYKFF